MWMHGFCEGGWGLGRVGDTWMLRRTSKEEGFVLLQAGLWASGTVCPVLRWRDAVVRCFVLCATGEGINALFDMVDVAFWLR